MISEKFNDRKVLLVSESNTITKCTRYGTRFVFFSIVLAGLSQIGLGIGFLLSCRSNVSEISCAFSLKTHPCTGLAAPAYLGCLVICIAIFGFGFLGRRASGVLLAIVMSTEIYFGLMLIYTEPVHFSDYFRVFNSAEMCQINLLNPNNLTSCWDGITGLYPFCLSYKNLIDSDCMQGYNLFFTRFNESQFNNDIDPCTSDINMAVSSLYTGYRYLAGPLMLLNASICLLLVPILDYLYQQDVHLNECYVVSGPKELHRQNGSTPV